MPTEQGASVPTQKHPLRRVMFYIALAAGCLVAASLITFLLFTDVFVNELLKGRNIRNFEKTNPNYSLRIRGVGYDILSNRFTCDSITLTPTDSGFSCTIAATSVSGVGWISLFLGNALTPEHLSTSEVKAEEFVLTFPMEQYRIRCGRLHVSVEDSTIVADDFELGPIEDDKQFFAAQRYRRTRYRLTVDHASMMGSTCLGVLRRDMFCGRVARLENPYLDILTNKDKRPASDTTSPLMPYEVLSTIKARLQIDSAMIVNGALTYGERMTVGSPAAAITFDSMNVTVGGIANYCCDFDSTRIFAQGRFMKTGRLAMRMAIPAANPEFSMQYSGSLGPMSLTAFNPFIKVAEHVRIKSGALQSANFDVRVKLGRANGTMRAVYRDLAIAIQDEKTGSEKGIKNMFTSFLANKIKIRNDNIPDESGNMKIGTVAYSRTADDTFFQFLWYSLRTGLQDVIGF